MNEYYDRDYPRNSKIRKLSPKLRISIKTGAFNTYIISELNEINFKLQGKSKTIVDMISFVNSFKMKFKLWITKLKKKDSSHFRHFIDEISVNVDVYDYDEYVVVLERISEDFGNRLANFKSFNTICSLTISPLKIWLELQLITAVGLLKKHDSDSDIY